MSEDLPIRHQLNRARLFLGEGQGELALPLLMSINTEDEQLKRLHDYLMGWYYVLARRWEEARVLLRPLAHVDEKHLPETPIERELLVKNLLLLGDIAVNMSMYEDASVHYLHCLNVLHERRVHLPSVRIRARYSLGMACTMLGRYGTAVQYFEDAIRLCKYYDDESELPQIYHNFCDAKRKQGDFINALEYGKQALEMYREREDYLNEANMRNVLGTIYRQMGDFQESLRCYTASLTLTMLEQEKGKIAGWVLLVLNSASLAELHLIEHRYGDAKDYSDIAMQRVEQVRRPNIRALAYMVAGKVAQAEARQHAGTQKERVALEEAVRRFEQAGQNMQGLQVYSSMAELYVDWAEVLEALGRTRDALKCWQRGFESLEKLY